jgi:hypothetical protein
MSNIIGYIFIGSLALCAVALGVTVLIVGIKMARDKDE